MRKGVRDNKLDLLEDPDFAVENPNHLFSPVGNALPLPFNVQSVRDFYGSKFFEQTLPLKGAEAPLVRNMNLDTGRSWDFELGKSMGAVFAPEDGEVVKVTPDELVIRGADGKKRAVDLYDRYPFNRYTMMQNRPMVKAGDRFTKGQVLAASNFTDDEGRMALGANARVAIVPFKGASMDDAVVISEDFARRLTSQHANTLDIEKDVEAKVGKNHFISLFPKKFTQEQLDKIGDDGFVKPGVILQPGDPVQLSTRPKTFRSDSGDVGRLSRADRFTRKDASVVWDGEDPAEVLDIATNRKGNARVMVSYESPARPGDKIVLRNGQKCYHPDTEIFTRRGWVPVAEVRMDDEVACLFDRNSGEFEVRDADGKRVRAPQDLVARFARPLATTSYHFDGELYGLSTSRVDYLVTGNHRVFCASHGAGRRGTRFVCRDAHEIHGLAVNFKTAAGFEWEGRFKAADTFSVQPVTHGVTGEVMDCVLDFPMLSFARFMAFYLAEGNVRHANKKDHSIVITQKQREYCRVMERTFDEMRLGWSYQEASGQYIVGPNKALRKYLDRFGKSHDKFIPDEIIDGDRDVVEEFIGAYFQCDGNKERESLIYTCSPKMAEGLERLLVMLGKTVAVNFRERRAHQNWASYELRCIEATKSGTRKNYESAFYKQAYCGPVHCVQVPGMGVIYTRRNNRRMWNGNSTISRILPNDLVPRGRDGRPVEVLLNQLGLPSRVNSSSYFEILLGKVAEKLGKPFVLPSSLPGKKPTYEFVEEQLAAAGVDPYEILFDPETGKNLEQPVTVGNGHILKLHHQAGKKLRYRGQGSYDINRMPMKGGDEGGGAQRLSGLEMSVLHSSGARGVQKEALLLRGEMRSDYWRALRDNRPPPALGKPFVWEKFLTLLNGSGIHAKDLGKGRLRLTPLTDRDLEARGALELQNGRIVDMRSMEPVAGGLFDPSMTRQQAWGRITLPVSMVNPAYEGQVRTLLGLKQRELDDLLDAPPGEKRASIEDVKARLRGLDLEELERKAYEDIRSGKKGRRQNGVKMLRAVTGLKRAGVSPEDLVISAVPVIPAGFRPYTVTGDTFLPGDANELYSDLFKAKQIYEESAAELGREASRDLADYVRAAARAVYGYGDPPNPKLQARKVTGFFKKVVGTNPKTSWVQGKLTSKPQDKVGRSVISPDPSLGMDQLSIPEDMAWELFGDHVERRLTAQGIPKARRLMLIRDRHQIARKNLEEEMRNRPVIYSRAPAWHRQNVISGYASITPGKNIRISPLTTAGFNADFDGDTMAIHVPILPEAVKDAKEKLLPSKMLFSIRSRDKTLPVPKHESLLGLYAAQTNPLRPARRVKDSGEALDLLANGEISMGDHVELPEMAGAG